MTTLCYVCGRPLTSEEIEYSKGTTPCCAQCWEQINEDINNEFGVYDRRPLAKWSDLSEEDKEFNLSLGIDESEFNRLQSEDAYEDVDLSVVKEAAILIAKHMRDHDPSNN